MEKLRIDKKNIYQIEVNDKGDIIEFDLDDLGLTFKLMKSLEDIEKIKEEVLCKVDEIEAMPDDESELFSDKTVKTLELWDEAFKKMRAAYDVFLGEGACQKIFGDRNYKEMFDDLTKELAPHFDKMGLNFKKFSEKLADKYSQDNSDTI